MGTSCNSGYECVLRSNISESTSNIECWGDNSCREVGTMTVTQDGDIECYGAFSCYKASTITSTAGINCRGLYSCAYVNYLYADGDHIKCHGELSCIGSTIYQSSSADHEASCRGIESCKNTIIYAKNVVEFSGHLSGENSVIYSDDSTLSVYFYGAESGKNAQVICQGSHTCTIQCYSNACNSLTVSCFGCTDILIYCYGENIGVCATDGTYVENDSGTEIELLNEYTSLTLPSLSEMDFSTYNNSFVACNELSSDAVNCGDSSQCTSQSITTDSSNPVPVCCTVHIRTTPISHDCLLFYWQSPSA